MKFLEGLFPIAQACLAAKQYDAARLAALDLVNEMEALAELAKEPGIILSQQMAHAFQLLGQAYAEDGRIEEFIAVERRRIAAVAASAKRVPHTPFQPVMRVAGAHEQLGMSLLKYDRPREAIAAFREAVEVYRKEFETRTKLGGGIDPNAARAGVDAGWRIGFELRKRQLPEWREFLRSGFELDVATKAWNVRIPPWDLPRVYGHTCAASGDYAEALRAYREGMTRNWPLGTNPDPKGDTPEVRAAKRREHPLDQWAGIALALGGKSADAVKEIPAPGATVELADYVRAALPALAGKAADTKPLLAELHARDRDGANLFAARELARMAAAVGPESGIDAPELLRLAELGEFADEFAWGHHFVALAHLRAGNLDKAVIAVAESREVNPRWQPALNNLVLALVAHKRGNAEVARAYLRAAMVTPVPFGAMPIDVVEFRLLLNEARGLIPPILAPAPREVKR
jgi:tetratricopeptide (TPR) repeat protein